jgi:hypothetical protein
MGLGFISAALGDDAAERASAIHFPLNTLHSAGPDL